VFSGHGMVFGRRLRALGSTRPSRLPTRSCSISVNNGSVEGLGCWRNRRLVNSRHACIVCLTLHGCGCAAAFLRRLRFLETGRVVCQQMHPDLLFIHFRCDAAQLRHLQGNFNSMQIKLHVPAPTKQGTQGDFRDGARGEGARDQDLLVDFDFPQGQPLGKPSLLLRAHPARLGFPSWPSHLLLASSETLTAENISDAHSVLCEQHIDTPALQRRNQEVITIKRICQDHVVCAERRLYPPLQPRLAPVRTRKRTHGGVQQRPGAQTNYPDWARQLRADPGRLTGQLRVPTLVRLLIGHQNPLAIGCFHGATAPAPATVAMLTQQSPRMPGQHTDHLAWRSLTRLAVRSDVNAVHSLAIGRAARRQTIDCLLLRCVFAQRLLREHRECLRRQAKPLAMWPREEVGHFRVSRPVSRWKTFNRTGPTRCLDDGPGDIAGRELVGYYPSKIALALVGDITWLQGGADFGVSLIVDVQYVFVKL